MPTGPYQERAGGALSRCPSKPGPRHTNILPKRFKIQDLTGSSSTFWDPIVGENIEVEVGLCLVRYAPCNRHVVE